VRFHGHHLSSTAIAPPPRPSGSAPRFVYITQTIQQLSIDLLDHDLFADHEPWEVFDHLQREAPVYRHPEPDGPGFWAVTKYDDVLAVLRDTKTFCPRSAAPRRSRTCPRTCSTRAATSSSSTRPSTGSTAG
jgi:cytochrome P450